MKHTNRVDERRFREPYSPKHAEACGTYGGGYYVNGSRILEQTTE